MIKPEKAIEIVTNYLNQKKIPYLRVFDNVKLEKGVVPHGYKEGKEVTSYFVYYDYETYDGEATKIIALDAETGEKLYGISSTRFLDID